MNAVELIRKKREANELTAEEIDFLIQNYVKGKIPDYQISAFLMAGFLQGLNKKETAALTRSMLYSGKVIDLSMIKGMKVDKHSTGGIGDKTSLILAPIVAAAGVNVPMISGRGLGHTGGTLDKLESIPGFRTDLGLAKYKAIIKKCGVVLAGQTKEVAPADKLIYALRDVTATVESIPFITGSIMSKKLAEGIDGLVLDVKTGSGAFMKEYSDAVTLAKSLSDTAIEFGKRIIAFVTDMNQPLGSYIGNWLEVEESVRVLQGERESDLAILSIKLAGAMIHMGDKAKSIEEGVRIAEEMIDSGKAFDKFVEVVKLQGGDVSYLKNFSKYPKAKFTEYVYSNKSGYIKSIDSFELGMASLELGGGRLKIDDIIDPKAGIIFTPKIGSKIQKGEVIAEIRTDKKLKIDLAKNRILNSIEYSNTKTQKLKLIKKMVTYKM